MRLAHIDNRPCPTHVRSIPTKIFFFSGSPGGGACFFAQHPLGGGRAADISQDRIEDTGWSWFPRTVKLVSFRANSSGRGGLSTSQSYPALACLPKAGLARFGDTDGPPGPSNDLAEGCHAPSFCAESSQGHAFYNARAKNAASLAQRLPTWPGQLQTSLGGRTDHS